MQSREHKTALVAATTTIAAACLASSNIGAEEELEDKEEELAIEDIEELCKLLDLREQNSFI
jgi:hypothetical protein